MSFLKGSLVVAALFIISTTIAAQDTITLGFEIYKNGALIGKPMIATQNNQTASLRQGPKDKPEDGFAISITPARIAEGRIRLALEVTMGEKSSRRTNIVISPESPGQVSWKSESATDTFEVRIRVIS